MKYLWILTELRQNEESEYDRWVQEIVTISGQFVHLEYNAQMNQF